MLIDRAVADLDASTDRAIAGSGTIIYRDLKTTLASGSTKFPHNPEHAIDGSPVGFTKQSHHSTEVGTPVAGPKAPPLYNAVPCDGDAQND